ncbi:MAG: BolA/IbaG family iron-sulfur metabolism protein [Candidatus Lightella neohaematopini]|nr:BolA/IbaG family iron-sulfur metabolism protein [Candidatus Lightella neohaematopini]MCV2531135.1 BolA/IbaG family iron-sulfur metabolism protein [Candidatus Lightella neohaematopini]
MDIKKIKQDLLDYLSPNKCYIKNHDNHLFIVIIKDSFINLSILERQQEVYKPLAKYIKNKIIHSVSITTYTTEEWKNYNNKK